MKYFINRILKKTGYQIQKYPDPDMRRRISIVNHFNISLLIDAGANTGQYSIQMRELGYRNKIVSFEPMSKAFSRLAQTSSGDSDWVINNFALGNENGEEIINISANSYSSSIREILPAHLVNEPDSKYIGEEKINIRKLDSVFSSFFRPGDNVMLKIDTQGYEMQVLEGAADSIKEIKILQLEMAVIPLYENEVLYNEMMKYISEKGFALYSFENGISDRKTGRLLQFDGIFVRE